MRRPSLPAAVLLALALMAATAVAGSRPDPQAERIARLEERVRRQGEALGAFRRELRSLPMLMTLAALVFAAVGAAVVVLKVRLS